MEAANARLWRDAPGAPAFITRDQRTQFAASSGASARDDD
jgi:hypothetical protein